MAWPTDTRSVPSSWARPEVLARDALLEETEFSAGARARVAARSSAWSTKNIAVFCLDLDARREASLHLMQRPNRERSTYRRLNAPIYARPAGLRIFARRRQPLLMRCDGIRAYSDDAYRVGDLLRMEIAVDEVTLVTCTAEVVTIEALGAGAPAAFDVALEFVDLEPDAFCLLMSVLGPES
jgi:hypothetical protein